MVDVHKGFDRPGLARLAEDSGFEDINFSTVYRMERETSDEGGPGIFPVFLMTARKA